MRVKRGVISAIVLALGLSGGAIAGVAVDQRQTPSQPLDVAVTGDFGSPVTVEVSGEPNEIIHESKDILRMGDGRTIVNGDQVMFRATSFDYATGSWTEVPNSGALAVTTATEPNLGELYDAIIGATEGSRIVLTQPDDVTPAEGQQQSAEIVVVDIVPTVSVGTPADVGDTEGWLTFSTDDDGRPLASGESSNSKEAKARVLLSSDGAQVHERDVIRANYRIFNASGEILEDTWSEPSIPTIALAEVYDGLRTGLTDQRVGSRVAIYIPAASAQGDEPVRIVVDILAISERPTDDESARASA